MQALAAVFADHPLALWGTNVVIQVTLIAALALVIARWFTHSPIVRWWVLGSALGLMLMSPAAAYILQTSGGGLVSFSTGRSGGQLESPPDRSVVIDIGEWALEPAIDLETQQHASTIVPAQPAPQPSLAAPLGSPGSAETSGLLQRIIAFFRQPLNLINVGFLIWISGSALAMARMLASWRRLLSIRRSAVPCSNEQIKQLFREVCWQLDVRHRPMLLQSARISSPFVVGVLNPSVLMPMSIRDELDRDGLRDILTHEVAHVIRRDQVIVLAQNLIACVFWIHPLARLVNKRFSQAREEVCDNHVLRASPAPSYSRTLLNLAERIPLGDTFPATVGALTEWKLESRIAGLLRSDRNTATRLTRRNILFVAAFFCLLSGIGGGTTISLSLDDLPATPSSESSADAAGSQQERPLETGPIKFSTSDPPTGPNSQAQVQAPTGVLPHTAELEFSGIVVDPNGEPVSNARVYWAAPGSSVLARSDARGNFHFKRTKAQLPRDAQWGLMKLVAVADGYGLAIAPALRFEVSGKGRKDLIARNPNKQFPEQKPLPRILKLVPDDLPIRGQIIDLEGQPVREATIQVRFVAGAYARFAFDAVATDQDGRFQINGIGRGRRVRLVAKGRNIEFSVFFARTVDEQTQTVATRGFDDPFDLDGRAETSNRVTYGATLTHAVGPSVPVIGTIRDAKSSEPVAGATVYAYELANNTEFALREDFNTTTDASGRFEIYGLPIGRSRLVAVCDKQSKYLPGGRFVHSSGDKAEINADFSLTKGILLRGQVTDAQTGSPILGYINYAVATDNPALKDAKSFQIGPPQTRYQTDSEGRYEIPVLPGRGYIAFRARNNHYPLGTVSADVQASQMSRRPFLESRPSMLMVHGYHHIEAIEPDGLAKNTTCSFSLDSGANFAIKFVDSDGQPVTGTRVNEVIKYNVVSHGEQANVKTDTYVVRHFRPDRPRIITARHAKRGLVGWQQIDSAPNGDLIIPLKRAGTISGRVVDDQGLPRPVRIDGYGRLLKTKDDGSFTLRLVPPGVPFNIRALHPTLGQFLGTLHKDLKVGEGETLDLGDIQVQRGEL